MSMQESHRVFSRCVSPWGFHTISGSGVEGAMRVRYWASRFWWMELWNGSNLIYKINKCGLPCTPGMCCISAFPWRFPGSLLPLPRLLHSASILSPPSDWRYLYWSCSTVFSFHFNIRGGYANIREELLLFFFNTDFLSLYSSKK